MQYRTFFILLFFTWNYASLYAADYDVRFLRGLTDRNLFESVEIFCNGEFQKQNVSAAEKNILAGELVRSRTQQMLLAEPKQRAEIQKRLAELETQFLSTPDEFADPELLLTRLMLQFQFAFAEFSLGDWQRLEADLDSESVRNEKIKQARTTLLDALERFKSCTEQVEILRQKIGNNADPAFERRCFVLLRMIQFQAGLAQKSFALSFPLGDDRIFSLSRSVEILTELAALLIDDPIVIQSCIELATTYRLLGNIEKCKECINALQNRQQKTLTPELRFQAETERIRYLLAAGMFDEAVKKALEQRPDSVIYPDYDLAKLEVLIALSYRAKENSEQQDEINKDILSLVRKIDLQSGAYWSRRAGMILGASFLAEEDGIDAPLLKMLAEEQFQRGRFTESIRFFELASRRAELAGDQEGAFKNAESAVAVLGNILDRLETSSGESAVSAAEIALCRKQTIDSLQNIAKRFSKLPDAAELHLKAIDLAAQSVLKEENVLADYLALLKEHAELWPNSKKIPPLLLRAAVLLESRNQSADALKMLEKIPNHSVAGLDAVNAALRCFSTKTNNLKIAEWFECRIPADSKAVWNEADTASAMFAAQYWIRDFSETKNVDALKKAELLLHNALEYFPELKPVTKVQVQAMLVTVLNDQGRKDEGAAILKMLNEEQIASLSVEEKSAFQRVQVKLLADTGKTQDAVNQLIVLLKHDPNDIVLLEILADILSRQTAPKALEKAVEIWVRIAGKSTKNTEIWWTAREQIIEIYLKQNKTAEAETEFEKLRLLYPDLGGEARKLRLETQFKIN